MWESVYGICLRVKQCNDRTVHSEEGLFCLSGRGFRFEPKREHYTEGTGAPTAHVLVAPLLKAHGKFVDAPIAAQVAALVPEPSPQLLAAPVQNR